MESEAFKACRFKPGQSGNPSGRPKSKAIAQMTKIIGKKALKKAYGMGSAEVDEWERRMLACTLADLQLIAKNDETPTYPKALAMAIIIDMKNGRTTTVDKIRDRQYGSVKQQVEVTGKNGAPLMPKQERILTQAEARTLIMQLERDF